MVQSALYRITLSSQNQVHNLFGLLDWSLSLDGQVSAVDSNMFTQLKLVHQICPFLEKLDLATVTHALVTYYLDNSVPLPQLGWRNTECGFGTLFNDQHACFNILQLFLQLQIQTWIKYTVYIYKQVTWFGFQIIERTMQPLLFSITHLQVTQTRKCAILLEDI